ncbi:MMPL family transporter [Geobacter argillaceus]|uniref:SSD domain-containing protein n=1 Tax=Geobacter argillaceus TaxID=345631 RepID=A0A562VMJ3_9BACT|nr:MMPL family transporter [Geobacter argillaceus]TWJ18994.1 hypothetical protein JN12_02212 [Geobacter argillaceus]
MPSFTPSRLTRAVNAAVAAHLAWIFNATIRRPRLVFASVLLLTALSAVSVWLVRFETDIFRLFPAHLPALGLLLDSLEWSGGAREAYFLLEGDAAKLPAETERFVERLKALRVDGQPAFRRVIHRMYDEAEGAAFADFIAYAVARPDLFVASADLPRLTERLAPTGMERSLTRLTAELGGGIGGMASRLAVADPLAIRDLILPRLKAGSQAFDLDPDSPYFRSRDGQLLIVIAEPARPVQEMAFARKLVQGINEARAGMGVNVSCAGAHISAVLDEAAMKGNVLSCILSSLVVVLGIFYAVYRRLLPTLLIPLILVVGVIVALGTAGLFLPSIHIISFAFMALIIGLGTDYSIHVYDRFASERAAGLGVEESLRLAVVETGHGLFTAAMTTALPFLALTIADVRALFELGLLVGLGVIFSLYATLLFLPPLLVWNERHFPNACRPLPTLGLGRLWRLSLRVPRLVKACSGLLVLLFLAASFGISFDGELKNLQPRSSEAFRTQERLERHLSRSPRQLLVAVEGPELAAVMARTGEVERLAGRYQQKGELVAWSSLGQVLNGRQEQHSVAVAVAGTARESAADLRQALHARGFAPKPFTPYLESLERLTGAPVTDREEALARLKASPLRGVVDRHLVRDGRGWHALVYLHYRGEEFKRDRFLAELHGIDPHARATGVELISSELAGSVQRSFAWGFVLGGLLVICLLVAHFESLAGIFSSLYPVVCGAVAMLGTMVLCGMRLNFMNAMVLVTIVGMGSDYGLHVGHRVTAGDDTEREQQFVQAGRAVLLSALTTIAGFGSLAFTDYGAMSSIGWATNFGVGFTALFALASLPAFLGSVGEKDR